MPVCQDAPPASVTSALNDAGRIINSEVAASQTAGCLVMRLGTALMEEAAPSPAPHRYADDPLAEHHAGTNRDVSGIEAHFPDEPDYALDPFGTRGVGEIATVARHTGRSWI